MTSRPRDEIAVRGDADFTDRASIWSGVVESVGPALSAAGFCTELELLEARDSYAAFAASELVRQTLALSAVTAIVP